MNVPFFRPAIGESEIEAVVECMRSGWLTTGQITRLFEEEFARHVGAKHAIALNSCTAALHLALDAIGLRRGEIVIVPTMTFAATAEVVRYFDAIPVFVDCDPHTQSVDLAKVEDTLERIERGESVAGLLAPYGKVRALITMHFGGQMVDVDHARRIATRFGIALVEDAAHTLPASFRSDEASPWRSVGTTADITCFSFYANKCITTGEGGMAVTDDDAVADRMRVMSLHGMSKDAWKRYTGQGSWYYEIVAPGFKYNLTDVASAIGRVQLRRAEELWRLRRDLAHAYHEELASIPGLELPSEGPNRRHAWHLFSVKLDLSIWTCGRAQLIENLKELGVSCSVHWQPLHMQPYYRETYGYTPDLFPVAASLWPRLITLPLYPGMTREEVHFVAGSLKRLHG